MIFVIETKPVWGMPDGQTKIVTNYTWCLSKADGSIVCRAGEDFASEKSCRSHIAAAKRSMKSAGFAKTVLTNYDGTASIPAISNPTGKDNA